MSTLTRASHVAEAVEAFMDPAIADGRCYWVSRAHPWGGPDWPLCHHADRWLMVAIDRSSNEACHLTVVCLLRRFDLEDPQWLPVVTAKVWTLQDAATIAGAIAAAAAERFEWAPLEVVNR